ncbi:MAG: hypothetical protein QF807_07960 [Candidatus Thalassarchaeaceae archaeon]|jgi:hypothetical protein|nr:hypothetical protein [Candidatus Thalassarchaeaceae archaeon]
MFGRWRKDKDESGLTCPLCGEVSPEETVECPKCYHQLGKTTLEQKIAVSEEASSTLFDELLAEEEEDEDGEIVDWSRHTFEIDDVAIDVSQYEEDSDSVTLSQSPNFAAIEADTPQPVRKVAEELEEGEYELTSKDAPKNVEKFVVPTSDEHLSPIEEPEHRVDLVVPLLPSGAEESSSDDEGPLSDPSDVPEDDEPPVEATPSTEESPAPEPTPEPSSTPTVTATPVAKPVIPQLPKESATSINGAEAPKLPATPTSDSSPKTSVPIPNIPQTPSTDSETTPTKNATAPALPTPPENRPTSNAFKQDLDLDVDAKESQATTPNRDGEMWPWPQQEAHDDLTVKRELRQVMESVKAGNLDEASRSLDKLGPHLGDRKEILFHVGVVLKKLGRDEALRRMLESARTLHPEDQHVATALTSLGM